MMEKILEKLKANRGSFVSGEELAQDAGISRAAIWKRIERLRAMGYEILSSPHKGYKLVGAAPGIHPFEIKETIGTEIFGHEIYFKPEVDSTNIWARALAGQGAGEGTVVIAESQSRGKGRLGRSWASAPGLGLWFSIILRPRLSVMDLSGINILTATAVAKAIFNVTGVQARIKWPNDLTFENRKLGGILTEINGEMERIHYMVLGIGLNINHMPADFPGELSGKATSLRMIMGEEVSRSKVLQEFLRIFEKSYVSFSAALEEAVKYATLYSASIGKVIKIDQGFGRVIAGEAIGLAADGSLLVRETTGALTRVHSGDIIETAG